MKHFVVQMHCKITCFALNCEYIVLYVTVLCLYHTKRHLLLKNEMIFLHVHFIWCIDLYCKIKTQSVG